MPRPPHVNGETRTQNRVSATIDWSIERLQFSITDGRDEVVSRVGDMSAPERQWFVEEAWQIGAKVLLSAGAYAEEAKLADVGRVLLDDVQRRLDEHLETQDRRLHSVLGRFFDPNDGQVTERLRAFVDDQGVLAKLLQSYLGADNSVLASTLARQVGESSALFKQLSPTESEGLVQVLEARIRQALEFNRSELGHALDPFAEDGALGQFLTRLRKELGESEHDRQEQLTTALRALDQNDENSLISTLLRENRAANDTLRRAVNPQLPDSPLATVKKTLEDTLNERLGTQEQRLAKMHDEQVRFQSDVRAAVERIDTRKAEQAKSPQGGTDFEDQVLSFLGQCVPLATCTLTATGSKVDKASGRKVGDAVIRFSDESAFAGCGVVVEAKRCKSYGVDEALAELEIGMRTRNTEVGLFVLAKCSAGPAFPSFVRYGSRILATWDPEDPISTGRLQGAVIVSLALAQRKSKGATPGDIKALADVEQRVTKEIARLETIDASANTIRKSAEKIREEVRKGRDALERVVDKAKETLLALNVDLLDEEAECASPIEIPECQPANDFAPDAAE